MNAKTSLQKLIVALEVAENQAGSAHRMETWRTLEAIRTQIEQCLYNDEGLMVSRTSAGNLIRFVNKDTVNTAK